jgi:hypothetical protein
MKKGEVNTVGCVEGGEFFKSVCALETTRERMPVLPGFGFVAGPRRFCGLPVRAARGALVRLVCPQGKS